MKNNDTLKQYIIEQYGSTAKFWKKENFLKQNLELALQKKDFFHQMSIGVKICGFLNIDAAMLFCQNEIIALGNENKKESSDEAEKNDPAAPQISLDDAIKEKYVKLSDEDQKKVLDYADFIFENGNGEA